MSTDQGTAWLHFGPSNLFVHALLIVGQTIFAGTTVGVYKSLLGESTWDSASTGLSNRYVRALALSPTGSLLAGTEGGICRTTGKVTGMATSQFGLPLRAMLFNAYPNPFNPLTTIRYGVPERSRVSLVVYNTLGQQVAQLVNGEVEAGYHEVRFDAAGLPSGVYLCRLQAGGHVEAKKLVVVR
jgi:hypothetical protein